PAVTVVAKIAPRAMKAPANIPSASVRRGPMVAFATPTVSAFWAIALGTRASTEKPSFILFSFKGRGHGSVAQASLCSGFSIHAYAFVCSLNFHGTDFVLWYLGRGINGIYGQQVCSGLGKVEGHEDQPGRGTLRQVGGGANRAAPRSDPHQVALSNAQALRIGRVQLDLSLRRNGV